MEFHKGGQIALIRCQTLPDKHTDQPCVWMQPILFIILSLYFPLFSPAQITYFPLPTFAFSPKHSTVSLVKFQNVLPLHPVMCLIHLSNDPYQSQRGSGELLPLTLPTCTRGWGSPGTVLERAQIGCLFIQASPCAPLWMCRLAFIT